MNRLDIAKIICPHAWEAETRTSERYREWALGLADQILALQSGSDVEQAFLNLCEELGIPATAGAYLEVPRLLQRAAIARATPTAKGVA